MIFAELKGKLGESYSRASERSEDLLTSTVFGHLRYLPAKAGFLRILAMSRTVVPENDEVKLRYEPNWIDVASIEYVDVEFWPHWSEYGIPDILLSLLDSDRQIRGLVVIEVKLFSPKSGTAGEDEEFTEERPDPDQLTRYWQGLLRQSRKKSPDCQCSVLYLTSHSIPPIEELAASLRTGNIRLGWISWQDVWRAVDSVKSDYLPAEDLSRLLEAKGLKSFDGFKAAWTAQPLQGFWKPSNTYFRLSSWNGPATGFWKE